MVNSVSMQSLYIIPVIIVIPKLLSKALEEKSLKPMYIDTLFQEITVL